VDLDERKTRVLDTRVPDSLDRHILFNTFDLVEDLVTESADIALSITGQGAILNLDAARDTPGGNARHEGGRWNCRGEAHGAS
jgi:hypothetical protein